MGLESESTGIGRASILDQKRRENDNLSLEIRAKEERLRELRKKRLCFAERKRELADRIHAEVTSSLQREIHKIIGEGGPNSRLTRD